MLIPYHYITTLKERTTTLVLPAGKPNLPERAEQIELFIEGRLLDPSEDDKMRHWLRLDGRTLAVASVGAEQSVHLRYWVEE